MGQDFGHSGVHLVDINFEFGGASADGSWRLGFIRVSHSKLN